MIEARDGNLFDAISAKARKEKISELLAGPGIRIERIVSTGQASPPDFWYDSDTAEWVMVLAGSASLRFEDEDEARELCAGDYVYIAPHRRHRVDGTDKEQPTLWLAVHFGEK